MLRFKLGCWLLFAFGLLQMIPTEIFSQDLSKRLAEAPVENLLSNSSRSHATPSDPVGMVAGAEVAAEDHQDFDRFLAKTFIESPTEHLIKSNAPKLFDTSGIQEILAGDLGLAQADEVDQSEKSQTVEPGRVKWHASFAQACRQSRTSGKPVLHFQLLGQLDQRFT